MPTILSAAGPRILQRPHHRVERIGDADDESVGRVLLDAGADRFHDLEIDAEQVVAAHAGLARDAGGDDDDVGAGDLGVGRGALELGVEALDGAGFGEVERLALRHAVDDVEQHDVAELLDARPDAPASRRSGLRRSGQSCFAPCKGPQVAPPPAALSPAWLCSERPDLGKPNFPPSLLNIVRLGCGALLL